MKKIVTTIIVLILGLNLSAQKNLPDSCLKALKANPTHPDSLNYFATISQVNAATHTTTLTGDVTGTGTNTITTTSTNSITINGNIQGIHGNPSFTVVTGLTAAPYCISGIFNAATISASNTYYFGTWGYNYSGTNTTSGTTNFYLIQGSQINSASFVFSSSSSPTTTTPNTITIYIRDMTTSVDYAIFSSIYPNNGGYNTSYKISGLNIPISNTDSYSFKIVSTAFASGSYTTSYGRVDLIIQ